jgi:hypothetical protein
MNRQFTTHVFSAATRTAQFIESSPGLSTLDLDRRAVRNGSPDFLDLVVCHRDTRDFMMLERYLGRTSRLLKSTAIVVLERRRDNIRPGD